MVRLKWDSVQSIPSMGYRCGYCGLAVASEKGWLAKRDGTAHVGANIFICHKCTRPTFIDFADRNKQYPGVVFGSKVSDIPDQNVESLYDEARMCSGSGAYTASVLCCRKLLMHIAVSKGALVGESFVSYVEYLSDKNYIPPDARDWVDHIRKKGNEANHEIQIMAKEDAEEILAFIEMLLKVIFEFPAAIKKKIIQQNEGPKA